jgi:argonaute-like protein implicated in RNA metabolism and viral defense
MSASESDLIVKLPFRVGLWMSRTDDAPGLLDDKLERAKLKDVITKVAKFHESSSIVRTTLAKTLSQAGKWADWSAGLDTVLADCETGLQVIKAQGGEEDMKVYRAVLMQTAICVAEAFQEELPDIKTATSNIPVPRSANDMGIPENISKKEKKALDDLKAALWK